VTACFAVEVEAGDSFLDGVGEFCGVGIPRAVSVLVPAEFGTVTCDGGSCAAEEGAWHGVVLGLWGEERRKKENGV
jgi:hypothetical protein